MKQSFKKRLGAALLAVSMLFLLLPGTSFAATTSCPVGQHTPGGTKYPADWNYVTGGYEYDYYECTVCGQYCHDNGMDAQHVGPCNRGHHADTNVLYPADYTTCGGGFQTSYYRCIGCGTAVDASGTELQPASGSGSHTPGAEEFPADYFPCTGGFKVPWYQCTVCGRPVDQSGIPLQYYDPDPNAAHTAGAEEFPADYYPCTGGFQTSHYRCIVCDRPVDQNGNELTWVDATVGHQPDSEVHPADYLPCTGGFKSSFHICTVCGWPLDSNGESVPSDDPVSAHTPGAEKIHAEYTPCGGGFSKDYYICDVCHWVVDENGEEVPWIDGDGSHDIELVPEQAPTYDAPGHKTYWRCKICSMPFLDAAGTTVLEDEEDILIPKLESGTSGGSGNSGSSGTSSGSSTQTTPAAQKVEVTQGLQSVPETVASQYSSAEAVQKVLVEAALSANPGLSSEGVQSVLLDVELKVQKADGSWETVTAENFPAEGVEVLLPYPEGTNKDDYTFIITHLITSGSKAGQTEVLQGTPEADGIRVRFTSLSPVVITYQAKDAGTAESPEETSSAPSETPAGTPGDPSESPAEAAPPKTGEAGSVVLWTLLSIGGLGAAALLLRRKTN